MVDGSKMDQREYHACGVGKKIAHLYPVEVSKGVTARGRRRSWEARWLTELSEVTHAPAWRANRQKLYCLAYDMGLVDMTSSGSRIVLENSLGACSRLSTG